MECQSDQYVGREFYGVWGSFDVKIHIDRNYVLGGTGYLQNPEDVGFGYGGVKKVRLSKKELRTWHFTADKVHDFAFAADPDYKHEQLQIENGPLVHLLYDPKTANKSNWVEIQNEYLQRYFDFMAKHFGKYPYDQFSIIQGGDGGMEYPMCTMMLGGGDGFEGFAGLFVHEATHNWYYGVIGTNEAAYPWMDEGFNSFVQQVTEGYWEKEYPSRNSARRERILDYMKSSRDQPIMTNTSLLREGGNNAYSKVTLALTVLREAVLGMLPKNKLRKARARRLRIFAGAEHDFEGAELETLEPPPRNVKPRVPLLDLPDGFAPVNAEAYNKKMRLYGLKEFPVGASPK